MNNFIYRWIFRPYRRICNIVAYAIQGWKTEDYDYLYLLQDIEFKIERMKHYLIKEGLVENKIITSMDLVLWNLKHWIESDHFVPYETLIKQKFGLRINKWVYDSETGYYKLISFRQFENSRNKDQVEKEEHIARLKGGLAEIQAKKDFFESLKTYIESWWS